VVVGSDVVFEIDEPIDPSTIAYPNVKVVVSGATVANDSVIPGTFSVANYVGPTGVKKSVITFEPAVDLPPDATIKLVMSGLEDFAGNTVSSADQTFTTEAGSVFTKSQSESFNDRTNENTTETNAEWGTVTPGSLTGKVVGGSGTTDLTVSYDTTLTGSTFSFRNLTVKQGATLRFSSSSAVSIQCSGDATIDGVIDVSGGDGEHGPPYMLYLRKPTTEESVFSGGAGGPGGGDGGSVTPVLPTSSGSYRSASGTDGKGSGPGIGGVTTVTTSYYGYCGGGGGHATAGKTGDSPSSTSYGKAGVGGSAYGTADLSSSGMMSGSGGGGGSGGTYYYYRSTTYYYYRYAPGAGGGGGGGSIKIEAGDNIYVRGLIDASGGDGGGGQYYGACGGGGSGGDIWLRAGVKIYREGVLDASGGKGGYNRYSASTSYAQPGGDGGGGRIMLEEPSDTRTTINAIGRLTTDTITSLDDGSGAQIALKPTSSTTLTTNSSNGGVFRFTEINIPAGVTVTIAGDRPARIIGRDGITVSGSIVSDGGVGSGGTYNSSTLSAVQGGSAGAGGYVGGRSHTKTGSVSTLSPEAGEDGKGPGGGEGGSVPNGYKYTYTYSYTYYYSYYAGSGGGASFGYRGEDGVKSVRYSYSYYLFTDTSKFPYYWADPGEAGDCYPLYDTSGQPDGGSGGGGGANAWYSRVAGTSKQVYCYGSGSGGGGGGSFILETPKTLTVTGVLSAVGGGGGRTYTSVCGGAGGGSGGSIVLRGATLSLASGTFDTSGGVGSRSYSYTYYPKSYYGGGGNGGFGNVRVESTSDLSLTAKDGMLYGSIYYKYLEKKDTGVSVWFDSSQLNPDFTALTASTSGSPDVWLEVAQGHLVTGAVDESTAVKCTPSEVSSGKADGFRYFRFYMKLYSNSDSVQDVSVSWSYRAK
jgi:hypothetical protein